MLLTLLAATSSTVFAASPTALSRTPGTQAPVVVVELSDIPETAVVCTIEDEIGRSRRLEWDGKAEDVRTKSAVVGASAVDVVCKTGSGKTWKSVPVVEGQPTAAGLSAGARFRAKAGQSSNGLVRVQTSSSVAPGQRLFGLEEVGLELAEDTLTILAEYTKTRFNQGVYELVGEKIEMMVCEDLSLQDFEGLDASADGDEEATKAVRALASAIGIEGALLPETCSTMRDVVLTELVNDPEPLIQALIEDLFNLGFRAVSGLLGQLIAEPEEANQTVEAVVAAVQDAVRAVVLDGAEGTELGPRLLTALGKVEWSGSSGSTSKDIAWNTAACAADVSLVAASVCRDTEECSAEDLSVLVDLDLAEDKKQLVFASYDPAPGSACAALEGAFATAAGNPSDALEESVRLLERLASNLSSDVHAVAVAMDSDDAGDDAPATIRLGFDMLIALVELDVEDQDELDAALSELVASSLGHLRDLTLGLEADEPRVVVVEGSSMLSEILDFIVKRDSTAATAVKKDKAERRKLLQAANRITPVVSTLSHNALALKEASEVVADTELDDEAREARLEDLAQARKTAIEDLVSASTKRSDRGGDLVVALGANPGFYLGRTLGDPDDLDDHTPVEEIPFTMPMGLSITALPAPGCCNASGRDKGRPAFGFNAQISALDLTYFLPETNDDGTTGEVEWHDAFMTGIQLGPTFGRPSGSLGLMIDLRARPFAEDDPESWRAGVGLTYGVPFFDLN